MITLRELKIDDMELIRKWRNMCLSTLRTSFPLTKEQQEEWYINEICNRNSRTRFWGIEANDELIGYGGIENIQWENRIGEVSLLINPDKQHMGYGKEAAHAIIKQAFSTINLHTVFAECYADNFATHFWDDIFADGYKTVMPNRKFSGGKYVHSIYYSVSNPHA